MTRTMTAPPAMSSRRRPGPILRYRHSRKVVVAGNEIVVDRAGMTTWGMWQLPPTPTPPLQGEGCARTANSVQKIFADDREGPLPLEGRDRVGGADVRHLRVPVNTPLPSSPARGEVWFGALGEIVPQARCGTSPLAGEDGRGVTSANIRAGRTP
jgi:hypothetical protein